MTTELVPKAPADVLADNTFGITTSDAPLEEKLLRLVALVPMALNVVDEARDTIARLRDRVEELERNLK